MNCSSCSRKSLSLFVRSFANVGRTPSAYLGPAQAARFSSATRRLQHSDASSQQVNAPPRSAKPTERRREKPDWLIQKEALKEKLGENHWNPRKKLSPDTMEGIRHLNETQPERFTTPVLAQYFKVSPEAIRRILKSNWRPSDEEQEERLRRWDKRGETIWSNLVELGVKPPKKWREMGVGRATGGLKPKWKGNARNTVPINDSVSDPGFDEGLIPIVDGKSGDRLSESEYNSSFAARML
ncbi:hypothetical protein K491DRAFT_769109 [Lophiostoma macrostomum CBS 122681]|uniref:Required for respiratory growth protein 9, mitochondrial n=1 Tax=Lophiostoma macrostomum CBS 122681 TaxID=1314788 RepID=A0A6A6T1Y2_9PLEO|nr:hypothetical protein K491DRAFT_769109 [Lophiostoma macrostomum CBS 122681]